MQTRGSSKLGSSQRKELMVDLCRSIAALRTPEEVGEALTDLLTPKEVETVGKRLQIADYLVRGREYEFIREELKVGNSTIARVNTWLNLSGQGFKMMLERRKVKRKTSTENIYDPYSWHNIKRRYSLYFWPQLLFEEFMKGANSEEKRKMEDLFNKMESKRKQFTAQENRRLYDTFSGGFKK